MVNTIHSNTSTDRLLQSTPFSTTISDHHATTLSAQSDEDRAGLWSRITLSWLSRLLAIGYRRPLTFDDVGPLPTRHQRPRLPSARAHNDTLEKRLYRFAAERGFGWVVALLLVADVSTYLTPILQAQLLELVEWRSNGAVLTRDDYVKGLWLCFGMFGLQSINTVAINAYYKQAMSLGMEMRAAIQAELYERILVMPADRAAQESGQLINMLTGDTNRIDMAVPFLNYWWSAPGQCLLVAVLLWRYVKWAGVVGVALLMVLVPIQTIGATMMSKQRRKAAHQTDCRLRLFQEVLCGIRTIKLKSWESTFLADLDEIRKREQDALVKVQYMRSFISMTSVTFPLFAFLVTMIVFHVVMGEPISQSITVTVIAYFALLRQPLSLMPLVVASTSDARAAIHRLSTFFQSVRDDHIGPSVGILTDKVVVELSDNSTFKWKECQNTIRLRSELSVKRGQLVVITGAMGSGKTSLLMAILGEMPLVKGNRSIGQITFPFASQQPWILNMTVRENICFISPFEKELYDQTVRSCQLSTDLTRLPDGDRTMIGERGANLSGGQKTRISLARAVYHLLCNRHSSVILMDDPLASVDVQVAAQLADMIVNDLRDCTRIVVTTNETIIERADTVVLVENGVVSSVVGHRGVIQDHQTPDSDEESIVMEPIVEDKSPFKDGRDVGVIQQHVFKTYLQMAGGPLAILFMLLLAGAQQLTRTMSDITASKWAYVKESQQSTWYAGLFTMYAVLHGLSFLLAALVFIHAGKRAGRRIHDSACTSIILAPLTWTSIQSPGRLTNRLSADLDCVDTVLPESMRSSVVTAANVMATLTMLIIHKWYNGVAIAVIAVLLLVTLQYYRASSREMGRLTAITKGPLQGHTLETINGLALVRAFNAQTQFYNRALFLIDDCSRLYYPQFALQRWLELRVTMAGNVLILLAALSTLLVTGPLALTSATMNKTLTVTRVLNWTIRRMADAELQFISVERLVLLTSETSRESIADKRKLLNPSAKGSFVEFRNVSANYHTNSTSRALHDVSFMVNPGERVGIVGRTGSGKSTLVLCLFRAIEPLPGSEILIDGVDTRSLPLHQLRRQIAVIPQDAFIFSASLRRNLDPEDLYPDDALWSALDRCMLKSMCKSLDDPIVPNEWSAGRRQLLAVCRVLLAQPSLLVMDEATASLDEEHERLVLDLVDEHLAECTVLTVAHRMAAVKRCSRVIRLEAGQVVQNDFK